MPLRFFILLSPDILKGNVCDYKYVLNYATTGVSSVTRRTPVVIVRTVTIAAKTAILLSSVHFFVCHYVAVCYGLIIAVQSLRKKWVIP